jgi:hypothetical protein
VKGEAAGGSAPLYVFSERKPKIAWMFMNRSWHSRHGVMQEGWTSGRR